MSISLFARLNYRFGPKIDREKRRQFLKTTAVATGAVLLSGPTYAHARQAGQGKRVVVIGAGFSGLAAAYELKSVGYDVTVVEARERISGRVISFNDKIGTGAFVPGKNVEGGGELIGNNHPCWVHYAQKFGLGFIDVTVSELESPIIIEGKRLNEEESNKLWEEMDKVFNRMNDDARAVDVDQPWNTPNAAALDKMSIKDWLLKQQDVDDFTRRACDVQIASDNGQTIDKQSYLGMLASIKGGDCERYWTDSEVYRCDGGNMQLAHKLADAVGRDKIILGLPVNAIEVKGDKVEVTCRDGRVIECDDVIVTAPPTTWAKIAFKPGLPGILNPQMGVNLKWISYLKTRFWKANNTAPDSLTDGFMSQSWEGTDAQDGDNDVAINCFSGGAAASKSLDFSKAERDDEYLKVLEVLFPGFKENFVRSRYMDWPREQWTMAGYSFPAPGQVTTVGPAMYKGLGKVHFAGEHTCYAYVGYMEGGLTSGSSVARRIAARDGLQVPEIPMPPAPKKEIIEEKPDQNKDGNPDASKGPLKTPSTEPATQPASQPAMAK